MRRLHYEYEQAWLDLGYRPNMASNKVCLPPPKEFVRVYRFLSSDHAIASIALRRLKVSRVSEMNDPYELLPHHRTGEMRQVLAEVKTFVDETFRFLCFSADWRSPVLWSHYADRYRGICLGFDMLRADAKPVQYAQDRTEFPISLTEASTEQWTQFAQDIVRVKFDHWRYEEEIRVMMGVEQTSQEGNLRFFNCDNSLRLAEVVLGLECSISVEKIRELVGDKHPDVVVFGTRPADKWFWIVPNEKTLPDTLA